MSYTFIFDTKRCIQLNQRDRSYGYYLLKVMKTIHFELQSLSSRVESNGFSVWHQLDFVLCQYDLPQRQTLDATK